MSRKDHASGALFSAVVLAACAPSDAYAPSDEPPMVGSPENFRVDLDGRSGGGAEEQLSVTGPLRTPVGSVAEIGLGPGAESLFAAIDVDEDGILTAAEFEVGMWQLWDVDGDGRVSAQEWQGGWFEGQPQGQTFAQWDVDGDGSVSRTEFAGTWTQVGLFDAWNTDDDTLLTAQEFQMALAETFDADEDVPPTFSQVR